MKRYIPGGEKDENGIYKKFNPPKTSDVSIDFLLSEGLLVIQKVIKAVKDEANMGGMPARESIMSLKDCMAMLESLKKREVDMLDQLSDEELKRLADANK